MKLLPRLGLGRRRRAKDKAEGLPKSSSAVPLVFVNENSDAGRTGGFRADRSKVGRPPIAKRQTKARVSSTVAATLDSPAIEASSSSVGDAGCEHSIDRSLTTNASTLPPPPPSTPPPPLVVTAATASTAASTPTSSEEEEEEDHGDCRVGDDPSDDCRSSRSVRRIPILEDDDGSSIGAGAVLSAPNAAKISPFSAGDNGVADQQSRGGEGGRWDLAANASFASTGLGGPLELSVRSESAVMHRSLATQDGDGVQAGYRVLNELGVALTGVESSPETQKGPLSEKPGGVKGAAENGGDKIAKFFPGEEPGLGSLQSSESSDDSSAQRPGGRVCKGDDVSALTVPHDLRTVHSVPDVQLPSPYNKNDDGFEFTYVGSPAASLNGENDEESDSSLVVLMRYLSCGKVQCGENGDTSTMEDDESLKEADAQEKEERFPGGVLIEFEPGVDTPSVCRERKDDDRRAEAHRAVREFHSGKRKQTRKRTRQRARDKDDGGDVSRPDGRGATPQQDQVVPDEGGVNVGEAVAPAAPAPVSMNAAPNNMLQPTSGLFDVLRDMLCAPPPITDDEPSPPCVLISTNPNLRPSTQS